MAARAGAATPTSERIDVSAEVGWGGWIKQDRWAPVFITLTNRGPARRLRLEVGTALTVRSRSRTLKEVLLPAQSRRLEVVYFRATNFSGEVTLTITELLAPGPDAPPFRFHRSYETELVGSDHALVVEFSASRAGRAQMLNADRNAVMRSPIRYAYRESPTQVVYVNPRHLPDRWMGYHCADAIVLSDIAFSQLRHDDVKVMEKWIVQGGRLLVLGGDTGLGVKDSHLRHLLPVNVTARTRLLDPAEEPWGRELRWKGDMLCTVYRYAEAGRFGGNRRSRYFGSTWFGGVGQSEGLGYVFFAPYNDLRPPVVDSAGWRTVLGSLGGQRSQLDYFNDMQLGLITAAQQAAVSDLPALQVPPRRAIIWRLLTYAVLLGPAHWLLSRRSRRLLAWITFPATIGFFTYLTYREGRDIKGTHTLATEVKITRGYGEAGLARSLSLIGVLSPVNQVYRVTTNDDYALLARGSVMEPRGRVSMFRTTAINLEALRILLQSRVLTSGSSRAARGKPREPDVDYDQAARLTIAAVPVKWGAMELFTAASVRSLNGGVQAWLERDSAGARAGMVENLTGLDLEDAIFFVSPTQAYRLGNFRAGQRLEAAALQRMMMPPAELARDASRLQTMLRGKTQPASRRELPGLLTRMLWAGQPLLVANVKNAPSQTRVEPGDVEYRTTEVLALHLQMMSSLDAVHEGEALWGRGW